MSQKAKAIILFKMKKNGDRFESHSGGKINTLHVSDGEVDGISGGKPDTDVLSPSDSTEIK